MRSSLAAALCAGAVLLAGCGGGGGGGADAKPAAAKKAGADVVKTTTRVEVVDGIGKEGAFDPRTIYSKESPGVVTVISVFGGGALDSVLGGGGGGGGLGSGFVLNGNGEIATNAHVVTEAQGGKLEKADEVYVAFADGNRVAAEVRGFDPNADVALLKIDPQGLRLNPLPLGTSTDVRVGSPVAAMGSPFGEEQSLSIGVVSAVDRDVKSLTDFRIAGAIQTDAAINPGNSGGPLVDAQGRVIGLNQQIQTQSGGNEGVGFAVPIDLAKRSIDQLREDGKAEYAYIGVSTQEVYPQLAKEFDLPVGRGAWVQEATAGGPAADAGIRAGTGGRKRFQASSFLTGGDIIVGVEARKIETPSDLAAAIATLDPGEKVDVEVYRGEEKRTISVELATRPAGKTTISGG